MKLIDILVEELPKRGGWPKRANCITQDPDKRVEPATCQQGVAKFNPDCGQWFLNSSRTGGFSANILASDYATAIITREQYESALAAKNDSWIDWGGGECPVDAREMVDVIFGHGGRMSANIADCWRWTHEGTDSDIIAYRLHKPQEAEQAEDDDEADLNECIGHDAAPVWNGEGVIPSVGYVCERSWAGDEWQSCEILFASCQIVVVKLKESGREDAYKIGDVTFRPISPIRSEADRKRDESLRVIYEILDAGTSTKQDAADIYDAIAAGKIPGVKLED